VKKQKTADFQVILSRKEKHIALAGIIPVKCK
jgi:hypothetical protein